MHKSSNKKVWGIAIAVILLGAAGTAMYYFRDYIFGTKAKADEEAKQTAVATVAKVATVASKPASSGTAASAAPAKPQPQTVPTFFVGSKTANPAMGIGVDNQIGWRYTPDDTKEFAGFLAVPKTFVYVSKQPGWVQVNNGQWVKDSEGSFSTITV